MISISSLTPLHNASLPFHIWPTERPEVLCACKMFLTGWTEGPLIAGTLTWSHAQMARVGLRVSSSAVITGAEG